MGAPGGDAHRIVKFGFFSFCLLEFKMTSGIESKLYPHVSKSFALQRKIAQNIHDEKVLKESQTAEVVEATHHDLNMAKNSTNSEENNFYCKYRKNYQNCSF